MYKSLNKPKRYSERGKSLFKLKLNSKTAFSNRQKPKRNPPIPVGSSVKTTRDYTNSSRSLIPNPNSKRNFLNLKSANSTAFSNNSNKKMKKVSYLF